MNPHSPLPFLKTWLRVLLLVTLLNSFETTLPAATYRVGDVATNFTFVARRAFTRPDGTQAPAGSIVRLHDFAGRIVFLEWFAVWCPYCVAAAPQVEAGIVEHYASRGGNPHGVPVIHVAVNQEPLSFYQTQTDNFITQQGFGITVNDYNSTSTNRVRFMFQNSGQPIFVAINGVTHSPTHQPWQVLVNHLGYGETDFNQALAGFRAVIDQVQPPAPASRLADPRLLANGTFEFNVSAPPGRNYRVEASVNLGEWTTISMLSGATTNLVVRDTNAPPERRFYRVVTP